MARPPDDSVLAWSYVLEAPDSDAAPFLRGEVLSVHAKLGYIINCILARKFVPQVGANGWQGYVIFSYNIAWIQSISFGRSRCFCKASASANGLAVRKMNSASFVI